MTGGPTSFVQSSNAPPSFNLRSDAFEFNAPREMPGFQAYGNRYDFGNQRPVQGYQATEGMIPGWARMRDEACRAAAEDTSPTTDRRNDLPAIRGPPGPDRGANLTESGARSGASLMPSVTLSHHPSRPTLNRTREEEAAAAAATAAASSSRRPDLAQYEIDRAVGSEYDGTQADIDSIIRATNRESIERILEDSRRSRHQNVRESAYNTPNVVAYPPLQYSDVELGPANGGPTEDWSAVCIISMSLRPSTNAFG